MPLETATYISELDPTNPVGSSDLVSSLDDHMRLVKATLQTTFPGITGAVTATHVELNHLDGVTGTTGTGKLVLDDAPTIADLTVTGSITLPAASIADAALSSNVMLTGAYGLGSQNLGSSVDMDFVNTTRFNARLDAATGPGGQGWCYLTIARNSARVAQIAVRSDLQDRTNGNLIAVRHSEDANNGLWYPWRFLWHTGNFDPDTKANASHTHSAEDITSGTLSDARLPATIGGDKTFSGAVRAGTVATSTSTTLAAGQVHAVTGNATLPNMTAGQWVGVINNSGSAITVTKHASDTMYWTASGSSVTSVTVAARGKATFFAANNTNVYASGNIIGSS